LLPRAVGGVEADMLITMGECQICGTVVGTCPDDRACTGIASMEKQSPGDSTSCPGDSMHRSQDEIWGFLSKGIIKFNKRKTWKRPIPGGGRR
jgi:hypothetical protein